MQKITSILNQARGLSQDELRTLHRGVVELIREADRVSTVNFTARQRIIWRDRNGREYRGRVDRVNQRTITVVENVCVRTGASAFGRGVRVPSSWCRADVEVSRAPKTKTAPKQSRSRRSVTVDAGE